MGAMIKRWLRRRSQPGSGAGGLGLPGPDEMPPGLPTPDAAPPGLDEVQPDLLAWAQALDVSRLSDRTFRQVEDFLRTYRHMNLGARQEQAWRLAAVVEAQVSPPPPISVHPMDVLATVLAARRKQLGIG